MSLVHVTAYLLTRLIQTICLNMHPLDEKASFCTPSQTLVASMTAMQFVSTDRDNATIWVARGAPRRWYAPTSNTSSGAVVLGAQRAPSRWGTVNFTVAPQADATTVVSVAVDFVQPTDARVRVPTLMVRVRAPIAGATIVNAVVSNGASADCNVAEVRSDAEIVVVRPSAAAAKSMIMSSCSITVSFSRL